MNISPELVISVVIQLIAIGIFIGVYKTTISFMQQQIIELKEDMRKYNNVLARLAVVEKSTDSCHKRTDEQEVDIQSLRKEVYELKGE